MKDRRDDAGVPDADELRAALRAHVREMAGEEDVELEGELTGEFLHGLPVLLADLQQGAEHGDQEILRRSAHTLKSHAVLFGATALEARTREIEGAAARGDDVDLALVAGVVADARGIASVLAPEPTATLAE